MLSCLTPGTTFFQSFKTFHYAVFDSDTTACIELKHLAPDWGAIQDNAWLTAQWRSARCAQGFLVRKPTKKCQAPRVWHPAPPSSGGYLPAWWIAVWRVLCRLCLETGDSPGGRYSTSIHFCIVYLFTQWKCSMKKNQFCSEVCPCVTAGEAMWMISRECKMWYERALFFIRYCWMQNTCKCDSWMSCTQFQKQVEEF